MYLYSTYIISLHKPDKLIEKLKLKGLNPILFNAINGLHATENQLVKNVSYMWKIIGPKSAIGCGLSHKLLWSKFLKTKSEYAVIFEDDIIYKNVNIKKEIEYAILNAPIDFDILYLGNIRIPGLTYLSKIKSNIFKTTLSLATHAYIISRKGANKLNSIKLFNHVDLCLQYYSWINYIKTYVIEPRLIYQTSTCSSISTNTPNSFPNIINKYLSYYYIDKNVRLSYISTVSCFRIGPLNITISVFFSILLLIYLYFTRNNLSLIFCIYLFFLL